MIDHTPSRARQTDRSGLQTLFDEIRADGYELKGPRVQSGAIQFSAFSHLDELAIGWQDRQEPGSYRLHAVGDSRIFGVNHGAESAKATLFPAQIPLWRAVRQGPHLELVEVIQEPPRIALIGLRPCDLHAIEIHDRVFLGQQYTDSDYRRRREATLLVVVNCTRSQPTCFCTSMNGGPRASAGYDLAITELGDQYAVEADSDRGRDILTRCGFPPADAEFLARCDDACRAAGEAQGKGIPREGLRDDIYAAAEDPHWEEIAQRCYSCTSCTQVCPTCFCNTPFDSSDLTGGEAKRERIWDSCFTEEFSYIHGGSIRRSVASRYRQWLTHKLAAWQDQFETCGCVGCGRCITWCPAGIDIRDEAATIRERIPVQTRN